MAAVRRLRPILMTSVATVAWALPLMFASGAGAAARRSIGVVVVWGVSLATLITLLLIPILYLRFARNTGSRSEEHTSELQSLMRISYAVFCLKKKKNIQHTKDI